jgi:hypothetical protein
MKTSSTGLVLSLFVAGALALAAPAVADVGAAGRDAGSRKESTGGSKKESTGGSKTNDARKESNSSTTGQNSSASSSGPTTADAKKETNTTNGQSSSSASSSGPKTVDAKKEGNTPDSDPGVKDQTLGDLKDNWDNAVEEAFDNGFTPRDNPTLKADGQGNLHYEQRDKPQPPEHHADHPQPSGKEKTEDGRDYDYADDGSVKPF